MKCQGIFTFIEISHIEPGTFINDKGQPIQYNGSYKIKVNERTEYGIKERIFKLSEKSIELVEEFKKLYAYEEIEIEFDVILYAANVKLIPIAFTK